MFIKLELLRRVSQSVDASARGSACRRRRPLGYFTGARILDTIGLISPVSVGYYPLPDSFYVINYAIPPALINDQEPEVVVILEVYGRGGLLLDPEFNLTYALEETYPTDLYGSEGMLVFRRR
jgi:hypothetical protein